MQYIVKKEEYAYFQKSLIQLAKKKLSKLNNEERTEDLDSSLCTLIFEDMDIEKFIEVFHVGLKMAYKDTTCLKQNNGTNQFLGGQWN